MIDTKQIQKTPRTIEKVTQDPATDANGATLFPKEVGGIVEWFARDSAGNITQITTNGSLKLPTVPNLVPSGGATNTMLAKISNVDYATAWKKIHQLQNEFYFKLVKAPNLADRLSASGTFSGLSLYTASADPSPEDEFGSSPNTLVIVPAGLSGVVLAEIDIMELNEAGAIETQGWYKFSGGVTYKSNKAMTKGAFIDFNNLLDTAKDILVRVRFIKPIMP